MFDLFVFRHTQMGEDPHQTLRPEQTHQIVFQRNVEPGFSGISLTAGTAAQLIVDSSGLVTFRADDFQAPCFTCHIIQLDIRSTAGHVGGDGNGSRHTGLGHDLRLQLMELGI